MSKSWEEIYESLREIKQTFEKSYKCLNKSKLPSSETQLKHITALVNEHSKTAQTLKLSSETLTQKQAQEATNFFSTIKNRLQVLFERLTIEVEIPVDLHSEIYLEVNETSFASDNTDTASEANNMPPTASEFLSSVSKLLPDFEGKFPNLQRFLDAIELVNLIKENHESLAITLIKSKLTVAARNLISDETSIAQIVQKLKKLSKSNAQ